MTLLSSIRHSCREINRRQKIPSVSLRLFSFRGFPAFPVKNLHIPQKSPFDDYSGNFFLFLTRFDSMSA